MAWPSICQRHAKPADPTVAELKEAEGPGETLPDEDGMHGAEEGEGQDDAQNTM